MIVVRFQVICMYVCMFMYVSDFSSSSSIGTTAHCELWPVEQCSSISSYLPPTLSIFSLPALEDLFVLLLSIFPVSSPSSRPFQLLSEDLFGHPIFLHSL